MRRQTSTSQQLYAHLFPNPDSLRDPPNFSAYLARYLIPEIRIETARFYGSLDTIEARYPGLNYTYAPHIKRLSTFPHHARLFRAIRDLRLSDGEVLDMVRWEGTLWARERFEKDEGVVVRDTTGDGIAEWADPRVVPRRFPVKKMVRKMKGKGRAPVTQVGAGPRAGVQEREVVPVVVADGPVEYDEEDEGEESESDAEEGAEEHEENEDEVLDDDSGSVGEQIESIGLDLNRRLLDAVLRRERGENVEMDPEFEAFLKEQIENGNLSRFIMGFAPAGEAPVHLSSVLNAASMVSVSGPQTPGVSSAH
ncbi:hypothetical protein MBLNU457_g0267t1 [Dothideomycetes sp. NU457]